MLEQSFTLKGSFHSLPTGKSFRTLRYNAHMWVWIPSCFHSLPTGKSFRTPQGNLNSPHHRWSFHSLPTGKSFRTCCAAQDSGSCYCFNSLPTGKSFRTCAVLDGRELVNCFNSLPTGKSFRTSEGSAIQGHSDEFQFPSNGKVLSDLTSKENVGLFYKYVSIPFQRESPFGRILFNLSTTN